MCTFTSLLVPGEELDDHPVVPGEVLDDLSVPGEVLDDHPVP